MNKLISLMMMMMMIGGCTETEERREESLDNQSLETLNVHKIVLLSLSF